jgi:filamentous hemagglutinin family protein
VRLTSIQPKKAKAQQSHLSLTHQLFLGRPVVTTKEFGHSVKTLHILSLEVMNRALLRLSLAGIGLITTIGQVNAQSVIPDSTLNTAVTQSGTAFTITNGTTSGTNLFHSFREFSLPTGGYATFDLANTPSISTIFSRVTGGIPSNIDGIIRITNSLNPVSLFLLNPSGILFGTNARLNIGGSFVGTTANSIKFADGTELSATNPTGTPLLTMSVPIGLQMGSASRNITVAGTGHTLTSRDPWYVERVVDRDPSGFQKPSPSMGRHSSSKN